MTAGMKGGMVVIPILMGCSSTHDVLNPTPIKFKPKPQSANSHISEKQEKGEESRLLRQNKSRRDDESFPKPSISISGGIQKLIQRSFKTFSLVFVSKEYYDENEDDYEEMVIGTPTDVEHLTHIGIGEWNPISSTSFNNISAGKTS